MNGQTEKIDGKVNSDPHKVKGVKTPESKQSRKKERTPRKDTKVGL